MSDRPYVIRESAAADIDAIQAIYAYHVETGIGSFEEVPPSAAELATRRQAVVDRGFPYLVAEAEGAILGYAYAAPFRPRSAYRFTVEDSIYVAPVRQRLGVGRGLLAALIERCTALGQRQMLAVIGGSENLSSIGLHAALGFTEVGRLPAVGLKFGRWADIVIMQRSLGSGSASLPD